jgi:hypothetical protein
MARRQQVVAQRRLTKGQLQWSYSAQQNTCQHTTAHAEDLVFELVPMFIMLTMPMLTHSVFPKASCNDHTVQHASAQQSTCQHITVHTTGHPSLTAGKL